MEQKVLYKGQVLILTRFWQPENLVYGLLTLSKLECPKWSLSVAIQMNTAFS